MTEHIVHPIPPLYDADSRVLILGSFPSVKSREAAFFYGHPQNRFWRVMARVLGCETPGSVPEKAAMLHAHHIALWDVIASCDISGSSDSSIQNAVPNDLPPILNAAKIQAVFCNGTTASRLYERYLLPVTGMQAVRLPSTSPPTPRSLLIVWRSSGRPSRHISRVYLAGYFRLSGRFLSAFSQTRPCSQGRVML